MPNINLILETFPFSKITEVYLTGNPNDIYRMYLLGRSKYAVRIDLKKGIHNNFLKRDKSSIEYGDLTSKNSPKEAIDVLRKCEYSNKCIEPNKETLLTSLKILEMSLSNKMKPKSHQYFISWIKEQRDRDDLIGDLAYDIARDGLLTGFESYEELQERISNETLLTTWDINSFKESYQEGTVNPLLVLRLAKMEYDIYVKKEKLKRFAIRNKFGSVYFFRYENQISPVKIGRAKNLDSRKKQLQTSSPYDLVLLGYIESTDYFELEKQIQEEFSSRRIKREWFNLTEDEVLEIIKNYGGTISTFKIGS